MADATLARLDISPDRLSFTVALHATRDQVLQSAAAIADTTVDPTDRATYTTTSTAEILDG